MEKAKYKNGKIVKSIYKYKKKYEQELYKIL